MYYVYIIKSLEYDYHYIGSTSDKDKRLRYHNQGSNKSTKPYRPFKLIYFEEFLTKREALRRERQLKSFKGGKALLNILNSRGGGVDNRTPQTAGRLRV